MTNAVVSRDDAIRALDGGSFDVIVVGGGITGAGIARDAALRGLRTALLERDDFASGTSSRSSRLVHGGVRYLEHGHIPLVFESSRERRILLRVARHLVRPLAFTWPVYRGDRIGRAKLFAGLALYDALALFGNVGSHARLSAAEVLRGEPALDDRDLLGGARYYDASTNDARLTLTNVPGAREAGAAVLNHAGAVDLVRANGRARGVVAEDCLTGRRFAVHARTIVNATGVESRAFQRLETPAAHASHATPLSKGAHIAVPRGRVENRQAITMLHPADERVLFVLPAGAQTIVSTTESVGAGAPYPRATPDDVAYLLAAANTYFPRAGLGERDVVAAWAGYRPLLADLEHGDARSASREHAVTLGALGIVSVTGGKLTTYRAMAEEVVDLIVSWLGQPLRQRSRTRSEPLPGSDFETWSAVWGNPDGNAPADLRDRLASVYGTRWRDVWAYVQRDPGLGEALAAGVPYLGAEVAYAVEREMAVTLGDVLIRRTHAAFETPDHALAAAPRVADIMARHCAWDAARQRREMKSYEEEIGRIF